MQLTEYLDTSLRIIQSILESDTENKVTAARAAYQIQQAIPSITWKSFGFSSFKAFIQLLEKSGKLKVGPDGKQALSIWATEKQADLSLQDLVSVSYKRFSRLKNQTWIAFVSKKMHGTHYLNKVNGKVSLAAREAPTPIAEWVEILPIEGEVQKEWAKEFLIKREIRNKDIEASLASETWYLEFPQTLKSLDYDLVREWNRLRSEKVSKVALDWCKENSVNTEMVFFGEASEKPKSKIPYKWIDLRHGTPEFADIGNLNAQREVMLAALKRMSTSELLELSIPAKYIFAILGNSKPIGD